MQYDVVGNLLSQTVTKGSAPTLSVSMDPATNRITGGGHAYDASGNLVAMSMPTTTYNVSNRLVDCFRCRVFRQVRLILVCAMLGAGPCPAESLKGTVFSDDEGPSSDAAGIVEIEAGGKIVVMLYNEPLDRRFETETCWDIGAIWTVDFWETPDSTRNIIRVSCSGQVDESAHSPWLVVRGYLQAGANSLPTSKMLSLRWRSSPASKQYEAKVKDLDFSGYRDFGMNGRCIDIIKVDRPGRRTRLSASLCGLDLAGKPVDLVFDVVLAAGTGRWEIDEIKVE